MIDKIFQEFHAQLKPQSLSLSSKGEILFKQGDAITHFYFIKKGKIKLIRDTKDGTPVILHIGQQGESIAEASLFSDCYHCSAVADTASEVLLVKKQNLLQLLSDKPDALLGLLALFSRQIRDLRAINEIKNIRSAEDRVLTFIKSNADKNNELKLNLSLKDMAYKIGLAHETFYRVLTSLEKSGKINRKSDRIKLLIETFA